MTPTDAQRFFSVHIDTPPARLWCQDSDGGPPLPLVEMVALRARKPDGPWRADECATPEVTQALRESIARNGWSDDSRVLVAIDPRGRCVLTDGFHRASAALAEGLPTIPACVVYRSSEWGALRYALLGVGGGVPTLYQPVEHPDFAAWPCWRTDTAERVRVIGGYLRASGPRAVVDLACHTGALARGLARAGCSVTGLDTDATTVKAARMLKTMDGEAATGVDFDQCTPLPDIPCADAVVVLSLLNHHWTDGRDAEGREVFRRCLAAAPLVILDAPAPGDPVGGSSPFADSPAEVFRWCAGVDPGGTGEVLAPRSDALQRTILAWHRSNGWYPVGSLR